jgi:hypothetical protein
MKSECRSGWTKTSGPGVDVMIAIVCDFCQFSAGKKWRFSHKKTYVCYDPKFCNT